MCSLSPQSFLNISKWFSIWQLQAQPKETLHKQEKWSSFGGDPFQLHQMFHSYPNKKRKRICWSWCQALKVMFPPSSALCEVPWKEKLRPLPAGSRVVTKAWTRISTFKRSAWPEAKEPSSPGHFQCNQPTDRPTKEKSNEPKQDENKRTQAIEARSQARQTIREVLVEELEAAQPKQTPGPSNRQPLVSTLMWPKLSPGRNKTSSHRAESCSMKRCTIFCDTVLCEDTIETHSTHSDWHARSKEEDDKSI